MKRLMLCVFAVQMAACAIGQEHSLTLDQAKERYDLADTELNARYQKAVARASTSLEMLRETERAWIKYRDACVDCEVSLVEDSEKELRRLVVLAELTTDQANQIAGHYCGTRSVGWPIEYVEECADALDVCLEQALQCALNALPDEKKALLKLSQRAWEEFSRLSVALEPEDERVDKIHHDGPGDEGTIVTVTESFKKDMTAQLAGRRLDRLCGMFPGGLPGPIRVSHPNELAAAVGPRRTVEVLPGDYIMTEAKVIERGYFLLRSVGNSWSPSQAEIHNVFDFTLRGAGADKTRLMVPVKNGTMLTFQKCRNTRLVGVSAQHGPQEGFCSSGVLELRKCDDFGFSECVMSGCGSSGVWVASCHGVTVEGCVIRDCTQRICEIVDASQIAFKECRFETTPGLIHVDSAQGLTFSDCDMRTCEPVVSPRRIEVKSSGPIELTRCLFMGPDIRKYFPGKAESSVVATDCTGY